MFSLYHTMLKNKRNIIFYLYNEKIKNVLYFDETSIRNENRSHHLILLRRISY